MAVYYSHIKTEILRGAVNHSKFYYSCEYMLHGSVLLTILRDLKNMTLKFRIKYIYAFNFDRTNKIWLFDCNMYLMFL
jgi:hypothetical protein